MLSILLKQVPYRAAGRTVGKLTRAGLCAVAAAATTKTEFDNYVRLA